MFYECPLLKKPDISKWKWNINIDLESAFQKVNEIKNNNNN